MDHALHHQLEPSRACELDLEITAGRWPEGLSGHAFIIGPAQPTAFDFVWTGSGIVTRIDLAPNEQGRPHWVSRFVETPDLALMGALAQSLEPDEFGALMAGSQPPLTNTSPHFFGDRLLLTYDMQRPAEFDPVTLEFRGYGGALQDYPFVSRHSLFPGAVTTGHPVEDSGEGCMWWCNVDHKPLGRSRSEMEGPLSIVRWDGNGHVQTWHVPGARITQGIHEVTVSRDYLILTEVGYQHEPGAMAGRNRTKAHAPYTDIYFVAKSQLTREREGRAVPCTRARVPCESFHEFADYQQDGDDVTIYIAHSNGWDIGLSLLPEDTVWGRGEPIAKGLAGFFPMPVDAAPVGRYVIDGRTGEVKDTRLFLDAQRHWATVLYGRDMRQPALQRGRYLWQSYWGCDPGMLVPRMVEMYRDHPYRIVPVDELPVQGILSSLVCIDLETMTEHSAWSFPQGSYTHSPVYVPDDKGGGHGWALAFVQFSDRTELQVFDALNLAKGPVAVAGAPGLKQSFQVHSGWMPHLRPQPSSTGTSFAADLGPAWKELPATVRAVVEPLMARYA